MKNINPVNNEIETKKNENNDKTNDGGEEETLEEIDREELEMQEFRKAIYSSRGICKAMDVAFLLIIVGILAFVWVFVYKLPIPDVIKSIFGMDDTKYTED